MGHYVDGKKHGEFQFYTKDGLLSEYFQYSMGNLDGKCIWYDAYGFVRLTGQYSKGVKTMETNGFITQFSEGINSILSHTHL